MKSLLVCAVQKEYVSAGDTWATNNICLPDVQTTFSKCKGATLEYSTSESNPAVPAYAAAAVRWPGLVWFGLDWSLFCERKCRATFLSFSYALFNPSNLSSRFSSFPQSPRVQTLTRSSQLQGLVAIPSQDSKVGLLAPACPIYLKADWLSQLVRDTTARPAPSLTKPPPHNTLLYPSLKAPRRVVRHLLQVYQEAAGVRAAGDARRRE